MNEDPQNLLAVAAEAAKAASALLVEKHHAVFHQASDSLDIDTKSSDTDFVTEADGAAQQSIISIIQAKYPTHRFIAEEAGADSLGSPDSPYEWIIDPLDGTTNFIHGKENFGSIVAVQKDGQLLAGVMDMPLLHQFYSGIAGEGAWINDRPVQLRPTRNMNDAVLASNTMRRAKQGDDGAWYVSMPYCGSVENYGCAAQELGEILLGQNDGAFFRGIRIWDVCTGCLMIGEAGGRYRYEFLEAGNPRSGLLCVASTAPIFDELCEFVFEKQLA